MIKSHDTEIVVARIQNPKCLLLILIPIIRPPVNQSATRLDCLYTAHTLKKLDAVCFPFHFVDVFRCLGYSLNKVGMRDIVAVIKSALPKL